MKVSQILAIKGSAVVTAQPHRTLAEIAAILADKGIGAIVITSADGSVMGIISERDVVRAIARDGAAALDAPVTRHMTARVVTIEPEATLDDCNELMTARRFRHLPVVANGALCGMISIGDAVKWRVEAIETERQALREYIASA